MLQDIRQSTQGLAAKVIIGLIVISFAGFGIQSILLDGGGGAAAEVNGEEIGVGELAQATNLQTRRLIAMMGENYNPELIDESRIRAQALDSLVGRKILMQAVRDLDLTVSEKAIGSLVGSMAQFQVNGAFDPVLYKQALSENGYTPASFKQSLRGDMMLIQLRAGLAESEFTTPEELSLNASVVGEQRDFRYLTIPGDTFKAALTVPEEAVEAYYAANAAAFLTEEAVDLEYIELSLEDFEEPVEEDAITDAYQIMVQNFGAGTESRVSHILFSDSGAALEQKLAAVQTALAEGASFADLAEQYSDDIGTARRGGDLGYSSGNTFPEPMEAAIAALAEGAISEPVVTDAGTHLIYVTERRETAPPSYEEMRGQLQASLAREEARVNLLLTVESLRDLSFNSEDLHDPAAELGLTVLLAEGVTPSAGDGVFESATLRSAAFSDEVLEAGHNSPVIELSGERFVVLRVKSHYEPRARPLEEVRDIVEETLISELAAKAITEEAAAVIAQLEAGEPMDKIAAEKGYEWQVELAASRQAFSAPVAILQRAFELPRADLPVKDFVVDATGDAIVIELLQVQTGTLDALSAQEQAQLQQQTTMESGALINNEFQQGLRQAADVVVM